QVILRKYMCGQKWPWTPNRFWLLSASPAQSAFSCGKSLTRRTEHERSAAVFLIAVLGRFPAHRTLFAIADRVDARRIHTLLDKKFLHLVSSLIAQAKVVFLAAAVIAIPFYPEFQAAMFLQPCSIRLQLSDMIRTSVG